MGVQAHPLVLKYGLNKLWVVNLPVIDYKVYALKSIYVKLYVENFLWYIAKVRYSRFFSFFPLFVRDTFTRINFFFSKYMFLNNLRFFRESVDFIKKIFVRKIYKRLKKNFLFFKVYYKDFVFNWIFLKYLYYKKLNGYKIKKKNVFGSFSNIKRLQQFLIFWKSFNYILRPTVFTLRSIVQYKKKKIFFFSWRKYYSLKLNFFFRKDNKINLLYLFKLKKKLYKKMLTVTRKSRYRSTRKRRRFWSLLKKKSLKKVKKKKINKFGGFADFLKNYEIFKIKNFKKKFKYGVSLYSVKKIMPIIFKNVILYSIIRVRLLQKNKKSFIGLYRLESFSILFCDGLYFVNFNTSLSKKLYYLVEFIFAKLITKQQVVYRDFFYLLRQLLIDRLEHLLSRFLDFFVIIRWCDIGTTLLYNFDAYSRELTRTTLIPFGLQRKWRSGYALLVNNLHVALYWGSSLFLVNIFYEKLINIRLSLPVINLIFNITEVLLKTMVKRKNVVIFMKGVFKKGAKKQFLQFNMFGFKSYTSISNFCDFSFLSISTRTGSLGLKIFLV